MSARRQRDRVFSGSQVRFTTTSPSVLSTPRSIDRHRRGRLSRRPGEQRVGLASQQRQRAASAAGVGPRGFRFDEQPGHRGWDERGQHVHPRRRHGHGQRPGNADRHGAEAHAGRTAAATTTTRSIPAACPPRSSIRAATTRWTSATTRRAWPSISASTRGRRSRSPPGTPRFRSPA